jgi:hypothetical protein
LLRECAARNGVQLPIRPFSHSGLVLAGRPKGGRGTTTKRTTKTKKVATKKKVKAKKAKKPAPKKRKVLTEKQKEAATKKKARDEIKELKVKALEPPKAPATTAWPVYVSEQLKGKAGKPDLAAIASQYKQLSPSEHEHYNHVANQQKAQFESEYASWLNKYTPDQIRLANNARTTLRRKLSAGTKLRSRKYSAIKDDRLVKGPQSAYILFVSERYGSGDFKNIKTGDATKLISQEWKELTGSEKKVIDHQLLHFAWTARLMILPEIRRP